MDAKEWWEKYDANKPPQYLQPPWAAAPSLREFTLPSSPVPQPPPPPLQGYKSQLLSVFK